MKKNSTITRRGFLGVSMLTFCLPTGLIAEENNDIILRFAALSDVHYDLSHTNTSPQHVRFARAIQFMNEYAAKQKYDKFDALVVAGDFSNHGVIEEIGPFKKTMDDNLKSATKRVLCMGNHEYYGGNRDLWEKTFATLANRHQVINGYHFITVSPEKGTCAENDYVYAIDWLEKNLAEAQADDPKKTIFVIQHYHVHSTVSGSYNLPGNFPAGVHDFQKTLRKYPQVFHISGHSHVPSVDPRSIWQGEFTAIGTGSMSYYGLYSYDHKYEIQKSSIAQTGLAGTFLLFDIFRDGTIRIKLYDTLTDSFHDREYLVVDPLNIGKFIYTNKRAEKAKQPSWPSDAMVSVLKTGISTADIEFSQGVDEQCLTGYRFTIDRLLDNKWVPYAVDFAWSDYFMKQRAPKIAVTLNGLLSNTSYRIRIFATNAFQKTSSIPLNVEFKTLADEKYVDRKSLKPQANVINLFFEDGKPVNNPSDPSFKSAPRILGKPQFIQDNKLGAAVLLNGEDECLQIPVSTRNYDRIRTEITIAVKFRLDLSKKEKDVISIFGNTESGGLAFEYYPKKKILVFICYFFGIYERIEAFYDGMGDTSIFGVYDGSNMILYLNGKPLVQKKQNGRIKYTSTAKARAFCVGGDITPTAGSRYNLPGCISYAAVYSWALTAEQIETLVKENHF